MNNPSIASAAPIVRRDANGVEVTFPKVNSGRLLQLMATWAEQDRARIIADHQAAGVAGEALLKQLREHSSESTFLHYGFWKCLGDYGRALEVLRASLGSETLPTFAEPDEACWVAAELWNEPMYRKIRYPTPEEIEERRAAAEAPKSNGPVRPAIGSSNPRSSGESTPEPIPTP